MKRFKNILVLADRDAGLAASRARAVDSATTSEARLSVMVVTAEVGLGE